MTLDLEKEASRVELKIKTNKNKAISLTGDCTLSICSNEQNIEDVNQFEYLESVVSFETGAELIMLDPSSLLSSKSGNAS